MRTKHSAVSASLDQRTLLENAYHIHRAGRLEEALTLYSVAIKHDPTSQVAHNLIGAVFCALRRFAEGEVHFKKAIDLNPSYVDAVINLANCRKEQGAVGEAEELYRRGIDICSDFPPAWCNLGLLYLEVERAEDAATCFRSALSIDSTNVDARNNLGVALRNQGLVAEAEAEFRAAVEANPMYAPAWTCLGDVLQLRGCLEEAEACCHAALELSPTDVNALNNLATVAKARGEFDVAKAHCDKVLRTTPGHLGALNNLGAIAVAQGDYATAKAFYRTALRFDPRHAVTRFNLATTLLTLSEYEEGFALYESRFDAFPSRYRHASPLIERLRSLPTWSGENRRAARLIIWGEQGLGDFVMMLRYISDAAKRVGSVAVLCDPALRRLVETIPSVEVITTLDNAGMSKFDLQIPVMSLPSVFRTRFDTVPAEVPYLSVPREVSMRWRDRIVGAKPKVGIAWAGSRTLRDDKVRSMVFDQLAPLIALGGVEWVSLQKGEAAHEWYAAGNQGRQCIEECNDLLDTAGLIVNIDLVISVDTAVAHLAGALGKRVWLLNRYVSEWRWGLSGEGCRWYPTMRIFRQHGQGDWASVVDRVVVELGRTRAHLRT